MSLHRQWVGRQGEDAAEAHLAALGWSIRDRNWRCKQGELDLVAQDGDTLVFVEVKAFEGDPLPGGAAINVTAAKQRQVARAAAAYLTMHGLRTFCRFDVVAVRLDPAGGPERVEHFKGAFTA